MADGGFDCRPSAQFAFEHGGYGAALTRDVDGGAFCVVATIAAIDEGLPGARFGEDFHLLQGLSEGVTAP